MPAPITIIPAQAHQLWHDILQQVETFDFYHLPEYHCLAEQNGEGWGELWVYREGAQVVAWPFLLRPIETVGGLADLGKGYLDATSVYGYAGPLASSAISEAFLHRFHAALCQKAHERGLVSLFSRLHPLIGNASLASGVGSTMHLGETISIDLTLDLETQWAHYRKSHRYEIRQAKREGLEVYHDTQWLAFAEFMRLYWLTMVKTNAAQRYFFTQDYFWRLKEGLGDRLQLFVARRDNDICAAALLVHTNGVVQYHLAGTNPAYAALAPSKLVLDEARIWGTMAGAHRLHLGGGIGATKDSLFSFKAGFSPFRHRFLVWHWITMPDVYAALVDARQAYWQQHEQRVTTGGYFPQYRS